MIRHTEIPLIKISIPFILGTLLGLCFSEFFLSVLSVFCSLIFTFILAHFLFQKPISPAFSFPLFSILLFSGSFLLASMQENKMKHFPEQISGANILITSEDGETEKYKRFIGNFLHNGNNSKVRLYLEKSAGYNLFPGDFIHTKHPLLKPTQQILPGSFDYPHYLKTKGITHQVFIKQKDTLLYTPQKSKWHFQLASLQSAIKTRILRDFPTQHSGLVTAILTGDKKMLNPELKQQFNTLGISHFLAVSGLHVGIIYLLISLVFRFKKYRKVKFRIPKLVAAITVLWTYAVVTGLMPSVVRATFMFSLMLIGQIGVRKGHSLNFLAAAGIVLLLFNPHQLFDLGFQLSFAAVAGILVFFQPIQSLISSRYSLINRGWDVISVSTSAQLATLPFILFYFGKFPLLFLISNLWLALFAGIFVGLCFTYLLVAFIPFISVPFIYLIRYCSYILQSGIEWMDIFSVKQIQIRLDSWEFSLFTLCLLLLMFYRITQQKLFVFSSVLVAFLFCFVRINSPKDGMQVFEAEKNTFVAIHEGRQISVFQVPYKKGFQNNFSWQNYLSLYPSHEVNIPQDNASNPNRFCVEYNSTFFNAENVIRKSYSP